MEWIKKGRAKYIINKFSSANDDASFRRVLRSCAANAKLFSVSDLLEVWSKLQFYWQSGLAIDAVFEFVAALSYDHSKLVTSLCDFMLQYTYNDKAFYFINEALTHNLNLLDASACDKVESLLSGSRRIVFSELDIAKMVGKYTSFHHCKVMDIIIKHHTEPNSDCPSAFSCCFRDALSSATSALRTMFETQQHLNKEEKCFASVAAQLYILFGNKQLVLKKIDEFKLPEHAIEYVQQFDELAQQGLNCGMWLYKARGS